MALITSAATGNFNAGATWTGGIVPGVGDEARASTGHTITITANVTCDEVSNAGTGIFTLASGVTLTANVTHKSATATRNCLQFTAASPAVGYIVGNCTGGTVSTAIAVNNTSTGTLNITGNCTGGSGATSVAANNNSSGILNITGNCFAGSASSSMGAYNQSTGILNITGATLVSVVVDDPIYGIVYDEEYDISQVPLQVSWWHWFFGVRNSASNQVIINDIPAYPNASITISITGNASLAVGEIVLGQANQFSLGMKYGASLGIQDYSRKETNDFGDTVFVVRAFAKRATYQLFLE
jgi:hypothetical protein